MARILNNFFFHHKFKRKLTRMLIDIRVFFFYKNLISESTFARIFRLEFWEEKIHRKNIMIVTFYSLSDVVTRILN